MPPQHADTSKAPAPRRRASGTGSGETPRNGRPRSEKSRRAILDATLKMLEEVGFNGLTIEAIAARAGVGKTTIYRWWPSRIALAIEALEELPQIAVPNTGSLSEDLKLVTRDLSELLRSTPLGSVLGHLAGNPEDRDASVMAYINERNSGVVAVLQRGVDRGELPAETDPTIVARLVTGPITNQTLYGATIPDDEYIDLVIATVTLGYPAALAQRTAPITKRRAAKRS